MKVLVTGGSGFIGTHFVDNLLKKNEKVRILDLKIPLNIESKSYEYVSGDVRDILTVRENVNWADSVVHLAGILGTDETMEFPMETALTNVCGALNVFQCIRETKKRCVYITLGNEWENPYTITKTASARFAFMYNREFDTDIRVVRGLNVYGPKQHWRPIQKAIPTFIVKALKNEEIPIYGDGEQTIDLVFVEDVARTLTKVLFTEGIEKTVSKKQVIDAGTGIETSVNAVVDMILKIANSKSKIRHLPMRRGEPIRSKTLGDISKIKKYNLVPKTELREGLEETIGWYKEAIRRGWK